MKPRKEACLAAMFFVVLLLCACGRNSKHEKTVVVLQTAAPTPTSSPTQASAPIAGEWFGWWRCVDAEGTWAYMDGCFWDCLAQMKQEADGTYSLLIWNNNYPKEKCLLDARLRMNGSIIECLSGSFLDIPFRQDREQQLQLEYKNGLLLYLRGNYQETVGGFRYEIWLRPWGDRWPEPEEERPGAYDSWYLPLIEDGSTMPENITDN